jgi:hypothetical protein
VDEFAARLRGDGVDVSLDQWMVGRGKLLPEFMEKLVRETEQVLIIEILQWLTVPNTRGGTRQETEAY